MGRAGRGSGDADRMALWFALCRVSRVGPTRNNIPSDTDNDGKEQPDAREVLSLLQCLPLEHFIRAHHTGDKFLPNHALIRASACPRNRALSGPFELHSSLRLPSGSSSLEIPSVLLDSLTFLLMSARCKHGVLLPDTQPAPPASFSVHDKHSS